jgi:hypothetical protein
MFALFSLSPLEILILGFLCVLPIGGIGLALLIVRLNRSQSSRSTQESQFTRVPGQVATSLEDEVHGLRALVKMQQEEIAALKNQVTELTEKHQSHGSTDITT